MTSLVDDNPYSAFVTSNPARMFVHVFGWPPADLLMSLLPTPFCSVAGFLGILLGAIGDFAALAFGGMLLRTVFMRA